ncbi:MAG: hypothetical protein ACOY3Y_21540 [Acidobacteriota bacterium]
MHQIDLSGPPEILEILHYGTYDLSEVHTYSDLDSTMWDVTAHADLKLTSSLWGTASYTRLDYQDDAPYVENQTGSLDIVQVALRWTF